MQKSFITITAAAAITALSAAAIVQSVDNPPYVLTNTRTVKIEKVELSDTATRVTFAARHMPGFWVMMSSESELEAGGKRYPVRHAEGIKLDTEHYMPASGCDTFLLSFAPLPAGTERFNFTEGNAEGAFRIYGVNLTDNFVRQQLPEPPAYDYDAPIPAPRFERKPATVNFRMINWTPDCPRTVTVLLSQEYDRFPTFDVDSTGCATVQLDLWHTNRVSFRLQHDIFGRQSVMIDPGETVNVCFDAMFNPERPGIISCDGSRLSPLAYLRMTDTVFYELGKRFIYPAFDYRLDPMQQTLRMADSIAAAKRWIAAQDYPRMRRQLLDLTMDSRLLYLPMVRRHHVMDSYAKAHPDSPDMPLDSVRGEFGPAEYDLIVSRIDPGSIELFYDDCSGDSYYDEYAPYYKPGSMAAALNLWQNTLNKAVRMEPYEDDLAALEQTPLGYLADIARERRDSVSRELAKLPVPELAEIPDVAPDRIVEAIVARHPGKVVVIDFWNTWCGPCRAGLQRIKPLKAELADEDVVWVYIADKSSTLTQYYAMLPDITGEHYLLSEDDKAALGRKYDMDGIPFYIVADRQGNLTARPDLRDINNLTTAIRTALNK